MILEGKDYELKEMITLTLRVRWLACSQSLCIYGPNRLRLHPSVILIFALLLFGLREFLQERFQTWLVRIVEIRTAKQLYN